MCVEFLNFSTEVSSKHDTFFEKLNGMTSFDVMVEVSKNLVGST